MFNFFAKAKTKYKKIASKEIGTSVFIPYDCLWNDHTVLTTHEWLLQTIQVNGFSFETADDEDVDIRKNIRNILWKGMASGSFGLYFHTIRRRKNAYEPHELNSKLKNIFARYMDIEWKKKHSTGDTFVNELYVTVIRKNDAEGVAGLEAMFNNFRGKADKSVWETQMKEMYTDLEEMSGRITSSLREYGVRRLATVETPNGTYSELLGFLGTLVNCGEYYNMLVPSMPINQYLARNRLFFGNRSIESRGFKGNKHAGIVSIQDYGPKTNAGMMDGFLQMPFEFVISQSFRFINKNAAVAQMQLQQNRMIQSEDKAVSQVHEINEALDMAMSGTIGFGKHNITILCIEQNTKALENVLNMASVELSNTGAISIREKTNMEPSYWAQLPSNYDYIVRAATINTLNLSAFASFHNYPSGKQRGNHWGDAATMFGTTSGTPFFFSFHVRDVGHTTIIGPTGAGKTVLMNFLCAQCQKFNPRMFFFDKDHGAEIFLRALGGIYTVIDPGAKCNFNPLQLPETSENRTFLIEWLKTLVTTNGEILSAEDQDLINKAVVGNYKLDQQDRQLHNIVPFLGLEGPGTLAGRMGMWYGHGSHAGVFDNETDALDFNINSTFGFEMGDLLKDKVSLGPVLLYLFHKINLSLDGTPTMIVLDEAWALIDNPVFAPKIKDWLKVLRKLNAFVIFATQSVEDAAKSAISDTLIQQTATQIFLPNLKANAEGYMDAFMLSRREFTLIKTTDPGTRFFLVKQGVDAVVARIDLSGMVDIINVLSGGAETVLLLDAVRKECGDEPEDWLPIFLERAREL